MKIMFSQCLKNECDVVGSIDHRAPRLRPVLAGHSHRDEAHLYRDHWNRARARELCAAIKRISAQRELLGGTQRVVPIHNSHVASAHPPSKSGVRLNSRTVLGGRAFSNRRDVMPGGDALDVLYKYAELTGYPDEGRRPASDESEPPSDEHVLSCPDQRAADFEVHPQDQAGQAVGGD